MLKFIVLNWTALLLAITAVAQQEPIKGKIFDESGAPIAGATVMAKGHERGSTVSGTDGSFTMSVRPGTILTITSVGYAPVEIAAKGEMVVRMQSVSQALADVVVTGVGVATSKQKVAIDVASVSSKDFAKSATTSLGESLDGQIAGGQFQQTSGQPGSGFNIILRGINALSGSPNPIILVDGVEVTDFTGLDPNTVDHIEVVKGAAAGTLYGAQGANGVIQIFTKHGTAGGKMQINVSSKISIDNALMGNRPLVSSHHYYVENAQGQVLDNLGQPISQTSTGIWTDPQPGNFSPVAQGGNPFLTASETFDIPTYNHLKQAYRTAETFANSVSVTGGGVNSDYTFAASQLNQQDVFSNSFNRTNLTLNVGLQPFKGFSFRSISQGVLGSNNLLGGNRFSVVDNYPFVNLAWRDSTGHYALKTSDADNSLNSLSERDWHKPSTQSFEIIQNFDFNYKFPRYLELDFKYGVDFSITDGFNYYLNQTAGLQQGEFWGPSQAGAITDTYTKNSFQNSLSSAILHFDFAKDFHINIPLQWTSLVTYDWRSSNERQYFAEGVGLPVYPPDNVSVASSKTTGDYNYAFTTFGVLYNQSLDWGNIFGITGGLRSDYSSVFGEASHVFTFYRGTVYFNPSEVLPKNGWLEAWKLRAADGEAGIQPIAYTNQTTFNANTLGTGVGLSIPVTATNPALQVQTTRELEIGTDLTVRLTQKDWFRRATLSGTYWNRLSDRVIQNANEPPSSGYSGLIDNLSTITASGVDLSLDLATYSSRNVTWMTKVRWGFTRSTLTKVANGQAIVSGDFVLKQGEPVGAFYGQTPVHSLTQVDPATGVAYVPQAQASNYTLVNGMVVNTLSNAVLLTNTDDQSYMGKAYPDFNASMINSVTLMRQLTISFQFDWTKGNDIYNLTNQWLYSPIGGSGGSGGLAKDFDGNVTINGKTGNYVAYYNSFYNLVNPVSWFVENGSFIRLKDLSATYDFTKYVTKTRAIRRLSATLSGRNLLTFTKYKGLDPENTTSVDTQGNAIGGFGTVYGIDYFGIPNLRSYQLSVNIGF